jgi:phosphoribosylformylglycinamidine cyclo-ligase
MARTFNCGIGLVVIVGAEHAAEATRVLIEAGETVYRIGEVAGGAVGAEPFVEIDFQGAPWRK